MALKFKFDRLLGTIRERDAGSAPGPGDVVPATGLLLWFDTEDLDLTDGETVDVWTDRMKPARTLSNDPSDSFNAAPKMQIAGGKKYVNFTNAPRTNLRLSSAFTLTPEYTLIFIMKQSVDFGQHGLDWAYILTDQDVSNPFFATGRFGSGGGHVNDVAYAANSTNSLWAATHNSILAAANIPFMFTAAWDGSAPEFYTNDDFQPMGIKLENPGQPDTKQFMTLGCSGNDGQSYAFAVRGFMYYERKLTADELRIIYHQYFG